MKLVDDVAKAWRWFSVQVFALVAIGTAVPGAEWKE